MPVKLWVRGREVPASWGTDVMVAPERQRQGVGEVLFRTWDRHVGAALGLGLSNLRIDSSRGSDGPKPAGALPGEAADTPGVQAPKLAGRCQSRRVGPDIPVIEDYRPIEAAPRRNRDDPTLSA